MMYKAQAILDFWYSTPMNQHWFKSTPELDQDIQQRFEPYLLAAQAGQLDCWKQQPESCLALIILYDQLPLNMYRGQAKSFASEATAIELCLYGIEQGYDKQLPAGRLSFFYMPLMHSESLQYQDLAVGKFAAAGLESNLRFARHHREIIHQFGRFPHRNKVLGRESTAEELEYLGSKQAFLG